MFLAFTCFWPSLTLSLSSHRSARRRQEISRRRSKSDWALQQDREEEAGCGSGLWVVVVVGVVGRRAGAEPESVCLQGIHGHRVVVVDMGALHSSQKGPDIPRI